MEFAHKMLPSDGAAAPTIRNSIYALPSTSSMQAAAHIYAARLLWCGEGEKETMELHKFDRVLVEGEMEYRKKQWRHFQLGNRLFQNLSTTKGCSGRRKTRKRPFKAVPVFSPSLPWQGIMFNLREVLSVLCRKKSLEFLNRIRGSRLLNVREIENIIRVPRPRHSFRPWDGSGTDHRPLDVAFFISCRHEMMLPRSLALSLRLLRTRTRRLCRRRSLSLNVRCRGRRAWAGGPACAPAHTFLSHSKL